MMVRAAEIKLRRVQYCWQRTRIVGSINLLCMCKLKLCRPHKLAITRIGNKYILWFMGPSGVIRKGTFEESLLPGKSRVICAVLYEVERHSNPSFMEQKEFVDEIKENSSNMYTIDHRNALFIWRTFHLIWYSNECFKNLIIFIYAHTHRRYAMLWAFEYLCDNYFWFDLPIRTFRTTHTHTKSPKPTNLSCANHPLKLHHKNRQKYVLQNYMDYSDLRVVKPAAALSRG